MPRRGKGWYKHPRGGARGSEDKLKAMHAAGDRLDVITFSGNGEPTLHPDFGGVVDDVIALRNKYYPSVKNQRFVKFHDD